MQLFGRPVATTTSYYWCGSHDEATIATAQMLENIEARQHFGYTCDSSLHLRVACLIGDISRAQPWRRDFPVSPEEAALEANSKNPGFLRSTPMTRTGLEKAKDSTNITIIAREGKEEIQLYFITGIRLVVIASGGPNPPVTVEEKIFVVPPSFISCITKLCLHALVWSAVEGLMIMVRGHDSLLGLGLGYIRYYRL